MTRKQAKREVDSLDFYLQNHTDDYGEKSHTAMMMAIKVLEQEPCEDAISRQAVLKSFFDDDTEYTGSEICSMIRNLPSVNPQPCEDAISREDALMALTGEWTEITDEIIHRFIKRIKSLPSVNPQHADVEIQKMQELEQAEIQKAYELGKAEHQTCEDAISRQVALDAMYALCDTGETLKENPWRDNPHIDAVAETIERLPSVNPQPKTGHWIYDEILDKHYYCSECKSMGVDYWDYCPYCGCAMKGESECVV